MTEKKYKMFDIGSPYLTYCGVKSDDDYFENMTECCEEMNRLSEKNEQLKQDKKRLIGFLHRYKGVDVEDVDEKILSKEYFDEWGNLYSEFKDGDVE